MCLLPYFAEVCKSIFLLSKHVTTERTWGALLQRQSDLRTDIENLDNTVVVDWRGHMVVCHKERRGREAEECSSNAEMTLLYRGVDGCEQRYFAECLYSRHQRGQFYQCETEALFRALSQIRFIYIRTMNATQKALPMTDMYAEVRKRKTFQHLLRCTAQAHMASRRKTQRRNILR